MADRSGRRRRGEPSQQQAPAEGVRIIGAEEAQAALDAGEAAGRRPDDQLRFGDVPPAPSGPRPAHRFPLPDSVDPAAAVELPPLAPGVRPVGSAARRFRRSKDRGPSGGAENLYADVPPDDADDEAAEVSPIYPGPPPAPGPGFSGPAEQDPAGQPSVAHHPSAANHPSTAWDPAGPPTEETPAWGTSPGSATWAGPSGGPAEVPDSPGYLVQPGYLSEPEAPVGDWTPHAAPEPGSAAGGPGELWGSPPAPSGESTTELGSAEIPEEGITVSGVQPEMPHWTDPPTGEIPRLRFDDDPAEDEADEGWRSAGSRGARWRSDDDWDHPDEFSDLAVGAEPMGALDQTRTEHSDLYSFDEDFERVAANRTGSHAAISEHDDPPEDDDFYGADPEPRGGRRTVRLRDQAAEEPEEDLEPVGPSTSGVRVRGRGPAASAPTAARASTRQGAGAAGARRSGTGAPVGVAGGGGGDVTSRVIVGAVLLVVLLIGYALGSKVLVVVAAVAVTAAAAEGYNMTRGAGFRPATLLGLVASFATVLAAYWRGVGAITIVAVLVMVGTMLWYVLGVVEARPLANAAVSVMIYLWVAGLGSFSAVLLRQHQGKGLFLGVVLVAVAADIGAFAVGRAIGSRPMAADISPNKTIEGYIGGILAALIVGGVVGRIQPWGGIKHGLLLGLAIGIVAPLGDLFESMLKRDLNLKDSGGSLGGHGGLLDRFDAILLALPVGYFIALLLMHNSGHFRF